MFTLTLKTDNAAFGEDGEGYEAGQEVARILREIAQKVERGEIHGTIRDSNGNTVGTYSL